MSSDALYLIAGLVIGAMAGLVIGWSLSRNRALPTNKVLEDELRQQISTRDTDLSALRSQLIEAKSSAAESQAQRAAAAKRLEEAQAICKNAEDKCEELRQKSAVTAQEFATAIAQLDAEKTARAQLFEEKVQLAASSQEFQTASLAQKQQIGKLEAERRFLTESLETERKQIQSLQEKFQKDFQAIANKLLIENSKTFDEKSSENLDKLLGPLRETFLDFKNRLDSVHRQNLEQGTLLKDQISRIGTEAANLTKALKGDAKVLGNWGENMLDQILEKSGLQSGIHYRRQSGVRGENGEQRILDVVIELPDGKHLVIDSKVSLRCYEDYSNCVDDSLRKTHLESHVACLRAHFRGLGEKGYHEIHEISTPDFVLMYIPIEPAFFSAVAADSSLFSEALEKNVVLITNSTLLATLRTVAHVWRIADQQKNVQEIAKRGALLYDKFVGFISDLGEIGNALDDAKKSWAAASKKLYVGDGNLVKQAEKLRELGVKPSKTLPDKLVSPPGLAEGDTIQADTNPLSREVPQIN